MLERGQAQLLNTVNCARVYLRGRVFVGFIKLITISHVLLGIAMPAHAQDPGTACALTGPSYKLSADTVVWQMNIGAGKSCIRGVRAALAQIDEIKLTRPPQHGEVRLEGPGFVFTTEDGFKGEDSFDLSITGTVDKVMGQSLIHLQISIR
jgi:hypothetical protein